MSREEMNTAADTDVESATESRAEAVASVGASTLGDALGAFLDGLSTQDIPEEEYTEPTVDDDVDEDTTEPSAVPDVRGTAEESTDDSAAYDRTDALEDSAPIGRTALWDGDSGELTLAQRRTLVRLLKKPTITATADPEAWAVLVADEAIIRSRLNDLFLDVQIDPNGVAFKYQIRSEAETNVPPLLIDSTFTREETVLLLFLRQKHAGDRAAGHEYVSVSADDCLEQIALFRPQDSADRAGDRNRAQKAIESAVRLGALSRTTDPDRFLITPVIESILPANRLRTLLEWFRQENRPGAHIDEPAVEVDDTNDVIDDDPDDDLSTPESEEADAR